MSRHYSAALPIAYVSLRILIVLNWIYGACILTILTYSFINEPFLLRALRLASLSENPNIIMGIRAIAVLGLVSIPLNLAVLKRLIAMIQTVRAGDPFVATNAYRLQAIAWVLLAQQLLSMLVGAIGETISTAAHPLHLDAGFSVNGWLAVLLTFVLARVFAEGALMREDLEGTV
jgi:hypothetical protein